MYILDYMNNKHQPKGKKMNNEKDLLKFKKKIIEEFGFSSERFDEIMNSDFEEIDLPEDFN